MFRHVYTCLQTCLDMSRHFSCIHGYMHLYMHGYMLRCIFEEDLALGWCFGRCFPKSQGHFSRYHFGTHFWVRRCAARSKNKNGFHHCMALHNEMRSIDALCQNKKEWFLQCFVKTVFHLACLISARRLVNRFSVVRWSPSIWNQKKTWWWWRERVQHLE